MHSSPLLKMIPVVAVVGSALASPAMAADAGQGRLAWSAFECSTYAELAGNEAEQVRLFTLGYNNGREFLAALQAGQIDQQAADDQTPIGLLMNLGGPSIDFMLGRVFAAASKNAFDKVHEETGDRLDRRQEIRQVVASNMYQSSNCALLR
jgi:hypothetical protein